MLNTFTCLKNLDDFLDTIPGNYYLVEYNDITEEIYQKTLIEKEKDTELTMTHNYSKIGIASEKGELLFKWDNEGTSLEKGYVFCLNFENKEGG